MSKLKIECSTPTTCCASEIRRWNPDVKEWCKPPDCSIKYTDSHLSILSWNIGQNLPFMDIRLKYLIDEIVFLNPKVFVLHEVNVAIVHEICRLLIINGIEHYNVSDYRGYTLGVYGTVFFSRLPFDSMNVYNLRSALNRKLYVATININTRDICLCAGHLESEICNSSRNYRQIQIDEMNEITKDYDDVIFVGDTNIRNDEEPNLGFFDDVSFETDSTVNWWYHKDDDERVCRLDRCFVKGKNSTIECVQLIKTPIEYIDIKRTIGFDPAEERCWDTIVSTWLPLHISDHHGLELAFKIN